MTGIGTDGSEYWRNVFFALAGGWVLVSFFRGWMQGILRQLLVPLAVFGASLVVVLVTPVASGFLYQNAAAGLHLSVAPGRCNLVIRLQSIGIRRRHYF